MRCCLTILVDNAGLVRLTRFLWCIDVSFSFWNWSLCCILRVCCQVLLKPFWWLMFNHLLCNVLPEANAKFFLLSTVSILIWVVSCCWCSWSLYHLAVRLAHRFLIWCYWLLMTDRLMVTVKRIRCYSSMLSAFSLVLDWFLSVRWFSQLLLRFFCCSNVVFAFHSAESQ